MVVEPHGVVAPRAPEDQRRVEKLCGGCVPSLAAESADDCERTGEFEQDRVAASDEGLVFDRVSDRVSVESSDVPLIEGIDVKCGLVVAPSPT